MPDGQIIRQNFEFPPGAGVPISGQYLLIDAAAAVDVGIWMPWPFVKGSFQVQGTFDGTCELLLSQDEQMPPNGFTITVGGSATLADVLTVNLLCGALAGGKISAHITITAGETTAQMATALKNAINAAIATASQLYSNPDEQAFAAAGFYATVNGSVVTILTRTALLPPVSVTKSVAGAATETLTIAQYEGTEGETVDNCSLTEPGAVFFEGVAQWVKARVPTWTSGSITAIVNGSAP